MADAYSRVSHKVGVVTAQNGPAATLLVPGLAEALKASETYENIGRRISNEHIVRCQRADA